MNKLKNIFLSLIALLLVFPQVVHAEEIYNPIEYPNNKFGIHISSEKDLDGVEQLVNGNGGEWGYITFVIREDERDFDRWKEVFEDLSKRKLIPIVRIATKAEGEMWKKPNPEDAKAWADFLSNLPWPIKNRYIVLFNEPNHAKEWGGDINPVEYTKLTRTYWEALKKQSTSFFILPAALDLAATNTSDTMEATTFWQKMYAEDNLIFTLFDGWNSHSYPNPNFSESPEKSGRLSIQGYKWEVNQLNQFHLPTNIAVFITETGWKKSKDLNDEKISEYFLQGFRNVWNDNQVVAVTPFIFNYDHFPFEEFSWISNGAPTKVYETIKSEPKAKGEPILNSILGIATPLYIPLTLFHDKDIYTSYEFMKWLPISQRSY